MISRTAISCYLCFLLFAGCSSSAEKKTAVEREYGEYEIADSPSRSSGGSSSKTHTIRIQGMKFEPEILNVSKGDTIIWVNSDIVEHDITEANTRAWASSKLVSGASFSMPVTKSELYYCNLHVVMKGKIVVDGEDIAMLDESGITMCKSIAIKK